MTETKRAPAVFISHGAGPYVLLRAPHQMGLVEICEKTQWILDGAKGVIMISAHWETDIPHIASAAQPHIFYDYDDQLDKIPKAAWEFKYPAPGSPDLAARIKEKLDSVGLGAKLDEERGWDHGVYTPMILLRPQADLPMVQVSIPNTKDDGAAAAFDLGRALEPFRDEGYVIMGSGSSWHNYDAVINAIVGDPNAPSIPSNRSFEDAMAETALLPDPELKRAKIVNWRKDFPQSVEAQPIGKSEHFLPFVVALGAAGADVGKSLGEWNMLGTIMSTWVW